MSFSAYPVRADGLLRAADRRGSRLGPRAARRASWLSEQYFRNRRSRRLPRQHGWRSSRRPFDEMIAGVEHGWQESDSQVRFRERAVAAGTRARTARARRRGLGARRRLHRRRPAGARAGGRRACRAEPHPVRDAASRLRPLLRGRAVRAGRRRPRRARGVRGEPHEAGRGRHGAAAGRQLAAHHVRHDARAAARACASS